MKNGIRILTVAAVLIVPALAAAGQLDFDRSAIRRHQAEIRREVREVFRDRHDNRAWRRELQRTQSEWRRELRRESWRARDEIRGALRDARRAMRQAMRDVRRAARQA